MPKKISQALSSFWGYPLLLHFFVNYFSVLKKFLRTSSVILDMRKQVIGGDLGRADLMQQLQEGEVFQNKIIGRGESEITPSSINFVVYPSEVRFPFLHSRIICELTRMADILIPLRNELRGNRSNNAKKCSAKGKKARHIWRPVHKNSSGKRVVWELHLTRRCRGRATASRLSTLRAYGKEVTKR